MPIPKTVENDIREKLIPLFQRGRFIDKNSIEYRSLEKQVQALIKIEPENGYDVMGALCSLLGDVEGMKENYKKALRLPHSNTAIANKILSHINLGFFSEAAEDIQILEKPDSDNLEAAIKFNAELGRFRRVVELYQYWCKRYPEKKHYGIGDIPRAADIFDENGIGLNDLLPSLDILGTVIRSNKLITFLEPRISVAGFEDKPEVVYQLYLTETPEKVADIEMQVIDALFESDINFYDSIFRFSFLSMDKELANAA